MRIEIVPQTELTRRHREGTYYGERSTRRSVHQYADFLSPKLLADIVGLVTVRSNRPKKVVDFACGEGRFVEVLRKPALLVESIEATPEGKRLLQKLARRGYDRQVLLEKLKNLEAEGVDINPRRIGEKEHVIQGTVHDAPWEDQEANMATSVFGLPYVHHPLEAINEMMRVTKPNGKIRVHLPPHLVLFTDPEHARQVAEAVSKGPESIMSEQERRNALVHLPSHDRFVQWFVHYLTEFRKTNDIPVLFLDEYLNMKKFRGHYQPDVLLPTRGALRFSNRRKPFDEVPVEPKPGHVFVLPSDGNQAITVYAGKITKDWKKYAKRRASRPLQFNA